MESLDQLEDIVEHDLFDTYEYRLMILSDYLEAALLLMLIACVWAIYRHVSKKALLPLILVVSALGIEVALYVILRMTYAALYIEEGSIAMTTLNWSSHVVYLLASISMMMLITNGTLSEKVSRSNNKEGAH